MAMHTFDSSAEEAEAGTRVPGQFAQQSEFEASQS